MNFLKNSIVYNKFLYKNNYLFLKKLFNMFIKSGLKTRIIKLFNLYINRIVAKFRKLKKKLVINIYIAQIVRKILPVFHNNLFFKKGERVYVPRIIFNKKLNYKKLNSLSCSWIKKSVHIRKEKTLFLKILSELESIRNGGTSNSLIMKKDYYKTFYSNKYYLRFLKKKNWV